MRNSKGQMHSPITMGLAVIGIFIILLIFSLTLGYFPEPKNEIEEMEINTYGNLFLINFLNYKISYQNKELLMIDMIVLYHDDPKPEIKSMIETTLSKVMGEVTGLNNPCFKLRINDVKEFQSSWSCDENMIRSEAYIPYADEMILITLEGE